MKILKRKAHKDKEIKRNLKELKEGEGSLLDKEE